MTNTETAALARIRQMTDHWEQHLPEVIRTPAVVSALRAAMEPAAVEPPADRAAVLAEAIAVLDRRASAVDALSSSDFGEEARAVRELAAAANELRRMVDEAPPAACGRPASMTTPCSAGDHCCKGPNETQAEACEGFVWIGQPFTTCDRCTRPAWEHAGEDVPVEGAGPFDTRRTVRPWKPGQADAMRAKWAPRTADEAPQDGARP